MHFHFPYGIVYYYFFFYNGPFRANLFDQHDNLILQRIFFFNKLQFYSNRKSTKTIPQTGRVDNPGEIIFMKTKNDSLAERENFVMT